MTKYNKITALYSRLSVGDEDRDGGESNSIQNQKIFLESYARQQKLTNIRHYIDDDESGRFFDRSGYVRMMEDVESGKVGLVIMKDMTRWGHDYLQVGNAMETFRRNNVRFIAINNGIDSADQWGAKQKKEYILDRAGNKIYDPKKRQYKCKSIPATDWNEQTKAEEWRAAWADCVNSALERSGHAERIDHRSYARQGIDQIPTVHLGAAAFQMEKRGIHTRRGDLNREIEVSNQRLRQLKARIGKLRDWLKEETAGTELPNLADYIQAVLRRRAQTGKSDISQSLYNLKDAANMLNFLTANNIMDMAGLDEKFSSMIGEQMDIQDKLKPVERRLATLKKHIEQADIYLTYKGKKILTDTEKDLFTEAHGYLKGVLNGRTTLPVKAWKEEYAKLAAERKTLNQRYLALKDEVKEAEQIRRSVYSIVRQEQRERQPRRGQDEVL